jgi:DNA-binding beta-propeller fold protein YncE
MNKFFQPLAVICVSFFLFSCHHKKVVVYADSDIQIDNSNNNITVTDGTTFTVKELEFSSGSAVDLNVQWPKGKIVLTTSPDDGLSIANLTADTIVGSYQHVGVDNGQIKLTTDQLKYAVDSLYQLTGGLNIAPRNKNYFIPPGKVVRITDNVKAKIFPPYTKIPGGFDATETPEVYKFYTNREVREIIERLTKMIN